eukprot:5028093-Prymnesium_polylepis.1
MPPAARRIPPARRCGAHSRVAAHVQQPTPPASCAPGPFQSRWLDWKACLQFTVHCSLFTVQF